MFKFIVEGYSDESPEAALADAMGKATAYMSESHDVNIAIIELSVSEQGQHKAVLEITIVPMSNRHTLHREGSDVELKHILAHDYHARRKYDEAHMKHLVSDHFAMSMGNLCPDIPDFYVAHLNNADLLNGLIEKQFLHAAHPPVDVPYRDKDVPSLKQVLGKPLKPEPGN